MSYAVTEIFKTLQGEGLHAGRSAIFVRFASCNLWNNHDADRERDAARNEAKCPRFCDTDFAVRHLLDHDALIAEVVKLLPAALVVFTGGEPLLQLDAPLLASCAGLGLLTAVETNGTVHAKAGVLEALGHVCVSPKRSDAATVIRSGTEKKVVVPVYNPEDYSALAEGFTHLFVSPEATTLRVGLSKTNSTVEQQAAQWCIEHPRWRLSLQTHKHLRLP